VNKYDPLTVWLRQFDGDRTTLSFERVEEILGSALPASSRNHEAHWRGTTPGRPGGAIAAAGWGVERVDQMGRSVTLVRRGPRRTAGKPPLIAVDLTELEPLAGSSAEQRKAEQEMLELLGRELGVHLEKRRLVTDTGAWTELDGYSADPPILVEAWAHQSPPKAAQKAKVLTDALKLTWAEATFLPGARKILLFSDEQAAARFRPGRTTWSGTALTHFGVEIRVVTLPDEMRAAVLQAQKRQSR
jgi:hypothetical protein